MKTWRNRLTIIVVLIALCLSAAPRWSVSAGGKLDKASLQALADKAVQDGLVGVSIAVYTPDNGLVLVVAGVSDKNKATPLQTTDIARIASCSKVWVAAVVMQFVQEGKISLTEKIAKYISKDNAQHIANANTATVAQLLSHTSGIRDYFNESEFGDDNQQKMDFTINEALKYAWDKPAKFSPGEKYSYSNTNTVLLAQALETISGKPFAELMRARLFEPLGLKHSFVEVFEKVPAKIVRGYEFNSADNPDEIGDKYQGGGLPDGALVTTPEDMVKFMRALFEENKIVSKATVEKMVTPAVDTDDGSMGLHVFVYDTPNGKRYDHDGSLPGYRAIQAFYPDSKVTVAMWTNTGGTAQEATFQTLQDAVIDTIFGK